MHRNVLLGVASEVPEAYSKQSPFGRRRGVCPTIPGLPRGTDACDEPSAFRMSHDLPITCTGTAPTLVNRSRYEKT